LKEKDSTEESFRVAIVPLLFFTITLLYGLFFHKIIFKGGTLPIEVLVLISMTFGFIYLMYHGYSWDTIQNHVVKKVGESVPVLLILFSIGVLIGSWIVSGTIPMLIYYGISLVNPDWIYIFAFLICIIFSMLTGTSWGSAGTIGVVMISISQVYDANLAITAAAVVGGSFFGDKMSPLSDTTNVASVATGVDLMDHIKSMVYTTGPSAIIAAILYIILSPGFSGTSSSIGVESPKVTETLTALSEIFNFHWALLVPLAIVLYGSIKRKPVFLTLLGASWVAMVLAFIFQDFTVQHVFESFNKGFTVEMATVDIQVSNEVKMMLNRGGLYNLIDGITIVVLMFALIGIFDTINAIPISIRKMMDGLKRRSSTVMTALTATWITNLLSSNQYTTSFIIGETFQDKFDTMKIPRKVLSRSIEDAGTMMENLAPWTPSGVFMASALGVSALEYAPWQFLSLVNIVIAYFFAATGIACFYPKTKELENEEKVEK
jgi:NhaC family Na+:H+ antiporter